MPWGGFWGGFWGGGSGGGAGTGFSVLRAFALTGRSVVVTYTEEPRFLSPLNANDAGNLNNITLTREDTGEVIPILTASAIADDPASVEYTLVDTFPEDPYVEYRITAANLISAGAIPLQEPKSALFLAMLTAEIVGLAQRGLADIRNVQDPRAEDHGGQLVHGPGADYELEIGPPMVTKLLIRRVVTARNGFLHARGYGDAPEVKGRMSPSDVLQLQAHLVRSARSEPGVQNAAVRVTMREEGLFAIYVSAKLTTGETIDNVPIPW